nr:pentatricopeptide repeat-containing protein At2g45350, chloroplastic [Ipomoea batatas]
MVLLSTAIQPWKPTLSKLSQTCKTQSDVDQIHAQLVTTGLVKDASLIRKLIISLSTSPYVPVVEFARSLLFSGYNDFEDRNDPFPWNAIIKSYSHGNCPSKAFLVFCLMLKNGIFLDEYSFSLVLKSCSRTGLVKQGMQVHGLLRKLDFGSNVILENCLILAQLGSIDEGLAIHCYIKDHGFVVHGKLGVALIDMYAKCGSIDNALGVFEDIKEKTVDHWNAMIGGLAVHGWGELAFDLFMEMERLSIEPDDITFIVVLNACGHAGLIKEGLMCFEIMRSVHQMEPKLQHYGCIVDILSRAGHMEEAIRFVEEMPIEPNDVVWRTLLSACSNHEHLDAAQPVSKHQIQLNSPNSSSYVLLSNIYARFGMWDYVRRIRTMMKQKELKKVPGCSWIEVGGTVHEFSAGDGSHPQVEDVSSTLQMVCS